MPSSSSTPMRFPAEWEMQSGVQLTWPHNGTDWAPIRRGVRRCFITMAREVAKRELLLIVSPDPDEVRRQIEGEVDMTRVRFLQCDTNDTWARDHAPLTLMADGVPHLMDFAFNGWGLKYAADKDNRITRRAVEAGVLGGRYVNRLGFVLEGGSVETDGQGTLLTTSSCLLSPNRNPGMSREEIEAFLCRELGVSRVLYIDCGHLLGDDTDGHIDTMARLCPNDTILYISHPDEEGHPFSFDRLRDQLRTFRTIDGRPYRLLALPMPDPVRYYGEWLPATYANYLVVNGAVLCPTYRQPVLDRRAMEVIQQAFPDREVVGVDCRPLIRQYGSLHCSTMQYPVGVLR